MPLRQKLRRAFLRLPCGHGGSQFAGSGESPVLIPPSRVCSPQIGLAAPAPSISRARGTPNPRENPENIPRASTPASVGRARQRDNGVPPEVKRLSAIGPEYSQNQESIRGPMRYDCNPEPVHGVEYDDNSELVHITGYDRHSGSFHDHVCNPKPAHGCEQIPQPIIGGESLDQPGSPLGSELRLSSISSQTSDYSNHSIIHTRIQPVEREEVTTVITREIHHIDIYPIIQPIIDTERLPRKHYLKTPDGKLIEITAEDAEQEGWDEVWRGDIVVGKEVDNGDSESTGIEELERRLAIDRSKTTPSPVPYINERILSDSSRKIPKLLGFGTRTGSAKKANPLHTSGERNILVGPAH